MTAREVFVISSGSYSDYRVHAVVDGTRDEALTLAARASAGTYEDYEIETLPVVSADVQQVAVLSITQTLWDDGTEDELHDNVRIEWPFNALYGAPDVAWRWVRPPIHADKGGRLEVHGTDHERVRKVFSDRRALIKTDPAFAARQEVRG